MSKFRTHLTKRPSQSSTGHDAPARTRIRSVASTRSGRPRSVAHHMSSKLPFEAIVEIHGPTVLRVCLAVVGAADADDAWSETFLSAMKAYPSLPDDANVEAWLVTIAHRRAIDVGRARSRRAVPTDSIVDRADRPDRTRTDADLMAALGGAARQATPVGGVPLPGRPSVRRGRLDPRRDCRSGATRCRRRDRHAPTLHRRCNQSDHRKEHSMNTESDLTEALQRALIVDPDHLDRLHRRLAAAADAERSPRCRLPHRRQPGRQLAARRHRHRTGAGSPTPTRITIASCRRCPIGSARASCTIPPVSTPPPASSTSTSPVADERSA